MNTSIVLLCLSVTLVYLWLITNIFNVSNHVFNADFGISTIQYVNKTVILSSVTYKETFVV